MSAGLWGIVAAVVAALLGGAGWLLRSYIHLASSVGEKESEIAAKDETIKRILKEKASEERIHASRPISDFDNSGRL